MTKKNKTKNKVKKKKTQDTGIVAQVPPVSTTMSSPPTLAETLGDKLDSLRHSMLETTNFSVTAGMLQDYLCKKIDDMAFSGPGNSHMQSHGPY